MDALTHCPKCRRDLRARTPACPACKAAGTVIDGRYAVEYELGRGTFGVVLRAFDRHMDRPVAIKMLNDTALGSGDAVRRFQEEARILSQVHHSNVLTVYEQGTHQNRHFVVFPFIEGTTLRERIPPTGFADPVRAARLVARLAGALHYVYSRHGILHRDVKPENLMCQDGIDDSPYLMDFGLAVCHQADRSRATQDGTVMGTPRYMSPEQALGRVAETDHRSDLYAAATILFELLTGRTPFLAPLPALYVEIIQAPPPRPSSVRPGLDPRLDAIVLKGLAKEPAARYQTGKEFADALEAWAAAPRAAVAVGAGGPVVTVKPLAPLDPPRPAPAAQVDSVVNNSTVNAAKRGTASGVVRRPPAARAEPPAEYAPARSTYRPPQPPASSGARNLFLALAAFGVLLVGVATLVYAFRAEFKSDPKKADDPSYRKGR